MTAQVLSLLLWLPRFRGVSKKKNKWEAKLMRARKWAFRELFDSEEEAARAYDKVGALRPETLQTCLQLSWHAIRA